MKFDFILYFYCSGAFANAPIRHGCFLENMRTYLSNHYQFLTLVMFASSLLVQFLSCLHYFSNFATIQYFWLRGRRPRPERNPISAQISTRPKAEENFARATEGNTEYIPLPARHFVNGQLLGLGLRAILEKW